MNVKIDRVRGLVRRLQSAHEEERRGLANELHDNLGQDLAVLSLEILALAERSDTPPQLSPVIASIGGHISGIMKRIQQMYDRLQPPLLDQMGLEAADNPALAVDRDLGLVYLNARWFRLASAEWGLVYRPSFLGQ